MIELQSGDIDLWLTFYGEIMNTQLHDRYLLLLNPVEREQQKRFYFERDRLRYLVTRALVRTILARYVPLSEPAWIFGTNAYGRPHIANPGSLAKLPPLQHFAYRRSHRKREARTH
jgi:4'-phosphopantetheinyl transferase